MKELKELKVNREMKNVRFRSRRADSHSQVFLSVLLGMPSSAHRNRLFTVWGQMEKGEHRLSNN